jgi:hypothetical protein
MAGLVNYHHTNAYAVRDRLDSGSSLSDQFDVITLILQMSCVQKGSSAH